jgi:glycerol-3-phosphate dehydrogenase (NAD(P)+)
MGLALASGKTVEEAQQEIQQVVEGVLAAKAVFNVSQKLGVDTPICDEIYRILYEGVPPEEAVRSLMSRAVGAE